jgi:hypothetical protein
MQFVQSARLTGQAGWVARHAGLRRCVVLVSTARTLCRDQLRSAIRLRVPFADPAEGPVRRSGCGLSNRLPGDATRQRLPPLTVRLWALRALEALPITFLSGSVAELYGNRIRRAAPQWGHDQAG